MISLRVCGTGFVMGRVTIRLCHTDSENEVCLNNFTLIFTILKTSIVPLRHVAVSKNVQLIPIHTKNISTVIRRLRHERPTAQVPPEALKP